MSLKNKNFEKKKNLIQDISYITYWLENNINKENTLNKLYYIIIIYIYMDKEYITDKENQIIKEQIIKEKENKFINENEFNELKLKLNKITYTEKVKKKKEVEEIEKKQKKIEIIKKKINEFFKKDLNLNNFNNIFEYNENINYFNKIQEKNNLYFHRFDLEIKLLPNFLNYDYIIILMWIFFCKALDKKNKSKKTGFLHDIYLFQNETDNIKKLILLKIILENMLNYIQFFDYDNEKNNNKKHEK